MRKHPEITMQTRKDLIDAFWQIYCEKRIEKITVKDITTKAGYNRSTFYEYFNDVYDVLEQLEDSVLPNLSTHHKITILTERELVVHFNQFSKIYQERCNYYSVLLGDNGDPAFQGKFKNVFRPLLMQLFSNYNTEDDFVIEYKIEYVLSTLIGVFHYSYVKGNNPPVEKVVQLIYRFMFNGVIK
jgi:AcrR family transcriptional regulator